MRFVAIPILILLVMSQTFSNWFVVATFNLNRAYIAKNLCENRYRPKMNCNGKCVLMKKMKEKENKEQSQPVSKIEITTLIISSKTFFATVESPAVIPVTSYNTVTNAGKPIDRADAIFHPPAA